MAQSRKRSTTNGITEGVIWKELLLFFFPILFGTFFQQLYNIVDAIIVGRFVGKEALSAVGGTTGTLINLIVGFFAGLSSGATVIISQSYGAGNYKNTSDAIHTAIALALAGGVIIMVIGLVFARPALILMNTPEDVLPYALTYMRIYFCGMIFNLLYNIGAGILRALGDSRRPLCFLITCCVTNIVLDLIFVAACGMGIAGVGLATILSQFISAVLVVAVLIRSEGIVHLEVKKIRFHLYILKPLIRIGIPAGLQSVMFSISNLTIQARFNTFGTDTVAAWTAYGKLDSLSYMTMQSFGIACSTFVGQNLGAGKTDRVFKSIHLSMAQSAGFMVVLSAFMLSCGRFLLGLFTTDAAVIEIGYDMMLHMVPFYVTYIMVEIIPGAMRGAGETVTPLVVTGLGICVFRVLWLFLVAPHFSSYLIVCISYPISWILTSSLFLIIYRRRKWLDKAQSLIAETSGEKIGKK